MDSASENGSADGSAAGGQTVWVVVHVEWDYDMTRDNMRFVGVFDSEDKAYEVGSGCAVIETQLNKAGWMEWPRNW